MNDRQFMTLCAGFLAVLVMGLFPPWVEPVTGRDLGYAFVLSPPNSGGSEVRAGRLLARLAVVAGATGFAALLASIPRGRGATPPKPPGPPVDPISDREAMG